MTRIQVALLTMLCAAMVGLPALAAAPKDSDVSALLPRVEEKKAGKKRLPTIKGTITEDKRWHLQPEAVHGKRHLPSVFFVIPRANPFPQKADK